MSLAPSFDFALVTAPFRMQPGLRKIAPGSPQLTPADPAGRHCREKVAVLSAFADEALCALPGFDALPLLRAIAEEAARCGAGGTFVVDGDDRAANASALRIDAPRLGWSLPGEAVEGTGDEAIGRLLRALTPSRRPAALLCLAFEEDFACIDGASGRLPWLAVALPSRWAPAEKLGHRFAEAHAPVADNARLLAAADALVALVTAPEGERWERFVWTITPEPRLHQHPARGAPAWPAGSPAEVAAAASFRHERQTFVPVPGTGQAVFTIHVESQPLARAIPSADAAGRVHDAIASMSPAVLAYRGLAEVRAPLLAWLAARAGA